MLQRFDIDTRSVGQGPDNWRDIVFADGTYQDEWGVVRSRPAGCLYYDLTNSPFGGGERGGPGQAPLARPPRPRSLPQPKGGARRLRQETDFAIALNMPGGVG